mmetsp:Transcript_23729/g.48669  ORF Transcript_23729/g.48669 Transcript_23729/m.48669 type:complete len:436 (+) Transcript_23729:492-1799(+)
MPTALHCIALQFDGPVGRRWDVPSRHGCTERMDAMRYGTPSELETMQGINVHPNDGVRLGRGTGMVADPQSLGMLFPVDVVVVCRVCRVVAHPPWWGGSCGGSPSNRNTIHPSNTVPHDTTRHDTHRGNHSVLPAQGKALATRTGPNRMGGFPPGSNSRRILRSSGTPAPPSEPGRKPTDARRRTPVPSTGFGRRTQQTDGEHPRRQRCSRANHDLASVVRRGPDPSRDDAIRCDARPVGCPRVRWVERNETKRTPVGERDLLVGVRCRAGRNPPTVGMPHRSTGIRCPLAARSDGRRVVRGSGSDGRSRGTPPVRPPPLGGSHPPPREGPRGGRFLRSRHRWVRCRTRSRPPAHRRGGGGPRPEPHRTGARCGTLRHGGERTAPAVPFLSPHHHGRSRPHPATLSPTVVRDPGQRGDGGNRRTVVGVCGCHWVR